MTLIAKRALSLVLAAWICFQPSLALSEPYTVKKGDNLSLIAHNYGVTVQQLKTANDIQNANMIHVGQVLVIPEGHASVVASGSTVRHTHTASLSTSAVPLAVSNDPIKIQKLRDGLDHGWVVTRNPSSDPNKLFVHESSSGGYLRNLRYLIKESADGSTWTVYQPGGYTGNGTQYGRKVGVMSTPTDVSVGSCSCN